MSERFTHDWNNGGHPRKANIKMGTLWCDKVDIDGEVKLHIENFDSLPTLAKLDLLDDFIGLLKREYDYTRKQWEKEDGTAK